MICEWCGREGAVRYYEIILPGRRCSSLICGECASAGMERGGGTVMCRVCGRIGARGDFTAVITRSRYSWWRRKMKVTAWECPEGTHES